MSTALSGRWIALARWSGRFDPRPLRAQVPDPRALLEASAAQLRAWNLPGALVAAMVDTPEDASGWPCLTLLDPAYPAALLELEHPPPVLWWEGALGLLEGPAAAVVGSRACTPYGRQTAGRLGRALAEAGVVVVSGAARGIDEHAHRGALQVGGGTVAVLGAGLARTAVAEAQALRRDILEGGGLLLSELPPLDPATTWTFPRRNRIIAALGRATVVVEAARRSGALITAREANALGREVAAVPGRWDAPASEGALRLIADGAVCVADPDAWARGLAPRPQGPAARLVAALQTPATVEQLSARLEMPVRELLVLLGALELQGVLCCGLDQRYQLRA